MLALQYDAVEACKHFMAVLERVGQDRDLHSHAQMGNPYLWAVKHQFQKAPKDGPTGIWQTLDISKRYSVVSVDGVAIPHKVDNPDLFAEVMENEGYLQMFHASDRGLLVGNFFSGKLPMAVILKKNLEALIKHSQTPVQFAEDAWSLLDNVGGMYALNEIWLDLRLRLIGPEDRQSSTPWN